MRVLVCGGREFGFVKRGFVKFTPAYNEMVRRLYEERELLARTLDEIAPTFVITGGARGADELAVDWANARDVPCKEFKANWYPNGRGGGLDRSAGPRRNAKMLAEGHPELVVAFAGGSGTADMVRRARSAGIEVREVETNG